MKSPTCGPGRLVVSRMKGTRSTCGCLSNLFFSALLAISPGFVLAAETRDGLQEKGATMDSSKYVTRDRDRDRDLNQTVRVSVKTGGTAG